MHFTSLEEWSRHYGANNKTRILVGTVLEVKIGPKETALIRRRTFVVARFYLGGGAMKVDTINIRSVKLHTPEPTCPSTVGDGGDRAAASTTTTTGDTTVTDLVSVQAFEAPAPDPLNDESFRLVVAQPMAETPIRLLSPLTEAGGSVVGGIYPMWWMHLLCRCLHILHFLDYFHFLKIFQFLCLLHHYLPYQLRILHRQSVIPLDKCL